jgi:hypothetical protein
MSRKKPTQEAMDRARAAAAALKPVAGQIKPAAENTRAAAGRQLRRSRAWAAPKVERTGQVLQDRIAPKVAQMLTTAAERIEPAKPASGRRWRVALAAVLTAAASGAAAVFGKRKLAASGDQAAETMPPDSGTGPAHNGQAASAGAQTSEEAHTS